MCVCLTVCVSLFSCVCVCVCARFFFFHIRNSLALHDPVPCLQLGGFRDGGGAGGLKGGGAGLCLNSRGCAPTHVGPTGTFSDTVSPLNPLWHRASGHSCSTPAQRRLALIGPPSPGRQSGHQSAVDNRDVWCSDLCVSWKVPAH